MVSRHDVIQAILDLYPTPSYLEIGVNQGETFNALAARRKVGVDPKFLFPVRNAVTPLQTTECFEMTSDAYFARPQSGAARFDVIFIDGLHVFEQALRDLMNAAAMLKPLGVIVVDDVIPNSYHASLPDLNDTVTVRDFLGAAQPELLRDGSWMGDAFKIPFFVQSFMQQYSYATVQENHGQFVMWHQPRRADEVGRLGVEAVARLEFRNVVTDRGTFNLRPLADIVEMIKARIH